MIDGLTEFIFFSYAILLKGDFRVNGSHPIRELCLVVPLCLMTMVRLCVLQPRLYTLTNKDIVVGN